MKNLASILRRCVALAVVLLPSLAYADAPISEDFTGTSTSNNWYFFNGACLTAGTSSAAASPGLIPSCLSIQSTYYRENLTGGKSGYLGSTTAPGSLTSGTPDPAGSGALRFTNGYPGGFNQSGAIVSANTFPTGQGVQVTFKTVTYRGNSGGSGGDGADGISFFLMDGGVNLTDYPGVGAYGGSLGYSCSNSNPPYDGLYGGYLGLGIDEYGNFLNGVTNTLSETGSTSTGGDNTATGGLYQPGRIGLRGAGHISWKSLTNHYGTNPNDTTKPYYPAALATTCSSGFLNPNTGACSTCAAGTFYSATNTCNKCASGTYNATTGRCDNAVCPVNSTLQTNGQQPNSCYKCSNGQSHLAYSAGTNRYSCTNGGSLTFPAKVVADATTAAPGAGGKFYSVLATQQACKEGTLYNYATPAAPSNAGAASLANTANTAKLLDYAAIPSAYSVLNPALIKIANEAAVTRDDGTPIFYNLKITQDGLLSFAYSINGGAYQSVISKQSISAANGPLPDNFRFGFAGSTGGSTNVHEIMCFKAAAQDQSGSSTGVNEKQSAKIEEGTQAYFAYYNPNSWTGRVTANGIGVNTDGTVFVASQANWDAACVLTGVPSGEACTTTGVNGPVVAQGSSSRNILTWKNSVGIPFKNANLTAAQKSALTAGDATAGTDNRLNYLRGDRTNEINSSGVGLFRARESVLGDIIDSSPTWVGPPQSPYTSKWKDRLFPSVSMAENSTHNYLQFVAGAQTRLNVVYTGSNDGMLHGFRTGAFDSNNQYVSNATTPNDGKEVLAYMPGLVVNSIHNSTDASVDYSNTQYGHNFSVDGTPGTGELFYGDAWHTWLVGGLGPGGAAIYALDITDPTTFSEANAASLVIGEWTSGDDATTGAITCSNVLDCGKNLGNTYGIPQIRRFHNGKWGAVFGNGIGSSSGDGGIYVMTVEQDTGVITFYYLSTGVGSSNGIAYVAPSDLDGDHVTDYVYAGDLKGHLWRFDLTSDKTSDWAAGAKPLFTTAGSQPITTRVVVASGPDNAGPPRLMIAFGTGQKTPITNLGPTTYVSSGQSLYGVWDWNLSAWNSKSAAHYAALDATATGLSGPDYTLVRSNLTQQTITVDSATKDRDITTNATVCFNGSTLCTSDNTSFGWYLNLPGTSSQGAEQIVFNPLLLGGAFLVNSTTPADNVPTSCSVNTDTGFTYAVSMMSGGALPNFFPQYHDTLIPSGSTTGGIAGVQTDATGTSFPIQTASGNTWLVYQTVLNQHKTTQVNPPANVKAKRLTWIELR